MRHLFAAGWAWWRGDNGDPLAVPTTPPVGPRPEVNRKAATAPLSPPAPTIPPPAPAGEPAIQDQAPRALGQNAAVAAPNVVKFAKQAGVDPQLLQAFQDYVSNDGFEDAVADFNKRLAAVKDPEMVHDMITALMSGPKEHAQQFILMANSTGASERDFRALLENLSAANAGDLNQMKVINSSVGAMDVALNFSRRCQIRSQLAGVGNQLDFMANQAHKNRNRGNAAETDRFLVELKEAGKLLHTLKQQPTEVAMNELASRIKTMSGDLERLLPRDVRKSITIRDAFDRLHAELRLLIMKDGNQWQDQFSTDRSGTIECVQGADRKLKELQQLKAATPPDAAAIEQVEADVARLTADMKLDGVQLERKDDGSWGFRFRDPGTAQGPFVPPLGGPSFNAHGITQVLNVMQTQDVWQMKARHFEDQAGRIQEQIDTLSGYIKRVQANPGRLNDEAQQLVEGLTAEIDKLRTDKRAAEDQAATMIGDMKQVNEALLQLYACNENCLNLQGFSSDAQAALKQQFAGRHQATEQALGTFMNRYGVKSDVDAASLVGDVARLAGVIEQRSFYTTTVSSTSLVSRVGVLLAKKERLDELLQDGEATRADAEKLRKVSDYVRAHDVKRPEDLPPELRADYDRLLADPRYKLPPHALPGNFQANVRALEGSVFSHARDVFREAAQVNRDLQQVGRQIMDDPDAPPLLKRAVGGLMAGAANLLAGIASTFISAGLALGHGLAELEHLAASLIGGDEGARGESDAEGTLAPAPGPGSTTGYPQPGSPISAAERAHQQLFRPIGADTGRPTDEAARTDQPAAEEQLQARRLEQAQQLQALLARASGIYQELKQDMEKVLQDAADKRKDRGLSHKDLADQVHDQNVGSHDEQQEAFFRQQRQG